MKPLESTQNHRRNDPESTQHQPRIGPEPAQNEPRIEPESTQNRPRTSGEPLGKPPRGTPGGYTPWGQCIFYHILQGCPKRLTIAHFLRVLPDPTFAKKTKARGCAEETQMKLSGTSGGPLGEPLENPPRTPPQVWGDASQPSLDVKPFGSCFWVCLCYPTRPY